MRTKNTTRLLTHVKVLFDGKRKTNKEIDNYVTKHNLSDSMKERLYTYNSKL